MKLLTWRSVLEDHAHSLLAVRHGATEWNVQDRVATTTDVELTEEGVAQATAAGKALSGVKIDRVICSPMKRARDTATQLLASASFEGEIEIDERLREPPAGPFEGEVFSELWGGTHRLSPVFARSVAEEDPEIPDGAEHPAETASKLCGLLEELEAAPGRYLLVSHGGLIRALAAEFAGTDPPYARRLKLDNCHAVALKWYDKPPHQVLAVNLPPGSEQDRPRQSLKEACIAAGAVEATDEEYAARKGERSLSFFGPLRARKRRKPPRQ